MSFLKKMGLTAAFMIVADLAIASTTGVFGLHDLIVDGGAKFAETMGIPQPDWTAVYDFFGLDPPVHDHAVTDPSSVTLNDGYDYPYDENIHDSHDCSTHGGFTIPENAVPAPEPTSGWE